MPESVLEIIARQRQLSDNRDFLPVKERRIILRNMRDFLRTHLTEIFAALREDLGKSEYEAIATEVLPLMNVLKFLIRNAAKFNRPKNVDSLEAWFMNPLSRAYLVPEPYGQVLCFATWNYPLLLALEPVAGAVAAGNYVVLKLAERSKCTMNLVRRLLRESGADKCVVALDEGDLPISGLMSQRYDYVFYTGSTETGKKVLSAAASNLTPCTLELGGKNPCVVAPGCDLKVAARRIVWGKFTNCGQTCIAPDYVIVHENLKDKLEHHLQKTLKKFYGSQPLECRDYPHLCGQDALDRICRLAKAGRIVSGGGDQKPEECRFEPTILDNLEKLPPEHPLRKDEIFGPVLPIISYRKNEDLLEEVLRRGRPLALYCFGGDGNLREMLQEHTSSGALVFDDTVMHFVHPGLPFGGVGTSGMGAYHGKRTFDTFCHYKPVMRQGWGVDWMFRIFRYPPYSSRLTGLMTWFLKHF